MEHLPGLPISSMKLQEHPDKNATDALTRADVLALCGEVVLIIGAQHLDLRLENFPVSLGHDQLLVKMVDLAFVEFFLPEDINGGKFCQETDSDFLLKIATHFLMNLSSGRLHSFLFEPTKSFQRKLIMHDII